MRKPKLSDIKVDMSETKRIRSSMASQKSIKITINIDATTLSKLKSMAARTGVPYQRLLNRTLQERLSNTNTWDDRLEKLERELLQIKKKLAA